MTPGGIIWTVTALLFLTGFVGLVVRRQLLAMLLCLELMVNAANLPIAYYAGLHDPSDGVAAILLVLGVAACEAVVGLALILALYRGSDAIETQDIAELRG